MMYTAKLEEIFSLIERLNLRQTEYTFEKDGELLEYSFLNKGEFEEGQWGYRCHEDGTNLITPDGEWQESWYVIGYEDLLGDPIVVDVTNPSYPIFIIEHDMENWEPHPITTLKALLDDL